MNDLVELRLREELDFWHNYVLKFQQGRSGLVPARAWDALEMARLKLALHLAGGSLTLLDHKLVH